jgi:hypothetical protein
VEDLAIIDDGAVWLGLGIVTLQFCELRRNMLPQRRRIQPFIVRRENQGNLVITTTRDPSTNEE